MISFATLDELRGATGRHLGWTDWMDITQERVNLFADATGDHQWIHVDVERAKRESPFKQTIAHGFLTLSLIPHLRAGNDYQIVGFGNATNYGADKLRFVGPVPAGAKIHARSRLVAAEAKPKGTQITTEINVHIVGSERPALIYVMLVLYHPPVSK